MAGIHPIILLKFQLFIFMLVVAHIISEHNEYPYTETKNISYL